jgi:hypothetical protein
MTSSPSDRLVFRQTVSAVPHERRETRRSTRIWRTLSQHCSGCGYIQAAINLLAARSGEGENPSGAQREFVFVRPQKKFTRALLLHSDQLPIDVLKAGRESFTFRRLSASTVSMLEKQNSPNSLCIFFSVVPKFW